MYKYVLNLVIKISLMFAQYFEYYAIILRGAVFCGHSVERYISHCWLSLRPDRGAEYCDQSNCTCVCVSVCLRAYAWNRWGDPHEILYADPPWPWLVPPQAALRFVMYYG